MPKHQFGLQLVKARAPEARARKRRAAVASAKVTRFRACRVTGSSMTNKVSTAPKNVNIWAASPRSASSPSAAGLPMFHVPVELYVRSDGETMVPLAGERHCFVNALYGALRASDAVVEIAGCLALQTFCRPTSRPAAEWLSELWRPASRRERPQRFRCMECVHWPAKLWVTVGPTVWLNGALLLTVAQNGFGSRRERGPSRPARPFLSARRGSFTPPPVAR